MTASSPGCSDLQHPPATIIEMYAKWKEGYEVVEGIKITRSGDLHKESIFHTLFAKTFYRIMSHELGFSMQNSSDYKLLDKTVVAVLASLKEHNPFFRALSFWIGFKTTKVYYEVADRAAGTSKWAGRSLCKYAVNNIISFSYTPLHMIPFFGLLFLLTGAIVGIDMFISYLRGLSAPGYPTIIILLLIGFGITILILGIIGIYIAKIYDEIKSRPQYIIRKHN